MNKHLIVILIAVILLFVLLRLTKEQRTARKKITSSTQSKSDKSASNLDWVSTDGKKFIDSSGRTVILRGFVTITNNTDGSDLNYTLEDYKRIRSLGASYQSIRLGAGALLGLNKSSYIQRVDQMVASAKEAGLYSELKLTTYDLRAFRGQGRGGAWGSFWKNTNSEQEKLIQAWKQLWQKYADEPAIVGYDLLNEPEKGNLNISDDEFAAQYLTPFYQKIIDELQKVDQKHLSFFQPLIGAPAYKTPLNRNRIVYAPHFYPNIINYGRQNDFSTVEYEPIMARFVQEAKLQNAPLLVGEYDVPWILEKDGDLAQEKKYQQLELVTKDLLDRYLLSFSRPHFADERACWTLNGKTHYCGAIIKGKSGLSGSERTFITDIFARPYPQRVAGELTFFSYDFDNNLFVMEYVPDQSKGQTQIFVPKDRHFPNGFTIHYGDKTITVNNESLNTDNFSWDQVNQILSITEQTSGQRVKIEITR